MFTISLSIQIFVMALWFGPKLQSQILKNLDPSEKSSTLMFLLLQFWACNAIISAIKYSSIDMLICKSVGVLMHDFCTFKTDEPRLAWIHSYNTRSAAASKFM